MTDWLPEMHVAPNQPDGWIVMHEIDSVVTKELNWPSSVQLSNFSPIPEDFHTLEIVAIGADLDTANLGSPRRIGFVHRDSAGVTLSVWFAQSTQALNIAGGRYDFTLGLAYASPVVGGAGGATSRESMPLFILQPGHSLTIVLVNASVGDVLHTQIRGRALVRP